MYANIGPQKQYDYAQLDVFLSIPSFFLPFAVRSDLQFLWWNVFPAGQRNRQIYIVDEIVEIVIWQYMVWILN